jgi:carboxyl-terminal processing protease
LFLLTLLTLMMAGSSLVVADLKGPAPADRRITLWVTSLLREDHLLKHPLDDEISSRALDMYLRELDPLKVYFLQSDVNEFRTYATRLDDMIKAGELSAAYKIFDRLIERVDLCTSWIEELVSMKHDFTANETLPTDPKEIAYAGSPDELKDRWRRRVKYELLLREADKETPEQAREKIIRRYQSIARRQHQTDSDELLEMFLTAVTTSLDPHTAYMAPSTLENFEINMKLNLDGIGAALKPEDGYTVVTKVIPGGAADKHGKLKPEDKIVSVGQGTDEELMDVVDMKLNDVVKLIRGRAGTVVRLGVIPAGSTETQIYTITRAHVELKDSEARSEVMEISARELATQEIAQVLPEGTADRKYKIGIIDLPSFYMDMEGARANAFNYKSSTRDVARILDSFRAQSVDCVVLDLSRNGGGSLTEAIDLTGLFIDRGPVVQIKDSNGLVEKYNDETPGMAWSGPVVVLISKFSASASEILAGAIQDYKRGLVIGDTSTHGKGTVQSLQDLGSRLFNVPDPPNYGALKVTMQQFYRPNGDSTQKRGVLSDVELPSITSHMDVGEADLPFAIEFDRIRLAQHASYERVTGDLVEELRSLSKQRVAAVPDFQKLVRNIERYRQQKDRKFVTLNAEEFAKERAELDAEREDEKEIEKQMDFTERPVFERNFYNDEVLALAIDYIRLLESRKLVNAP